MSLKASTNLQFHSVGLREFQIFAPVTAIDGRDYGVDDTSSETGNKKGDSLLTNYEPVHENMPAAADHGIV